MKIRKESLFSLTWPVFVEMILGTLVGNVDQFMLSSYSQEAVAAVGNANQILNVLGVLFSVINLSTMILASQYAGSFQTKRTQVVYNLTVVMNVAISLLISIIIFIFGRSIFQMMSVPSEVMEQTLAFTYIVGGGIVFQGLYIALGTIFKTEKMMKVTMYISVAINIFNVGFNLIFINGLGPIPAMGAAGAGLSTVISRFIGLAICILFVYKKTQFRLQKEYLVPFPVMELKKMLGIGLPSAGENISYGMSQAVILRIVNSFGYLYITNAKFYVSMFQWISVLYSVAVSQVAQILVSRSIGAGDVEEANTRIWKTWLYCVTTGFVLVTLVYIFGDNLVGLFTDDVRTIQLAKTIFFIDIFLQVGKCTNVCMVRCLQATGDTKFPIVLGILCMWIIAVGGSYVLGVVFELGLVGVWIAMAADELIRAVCFLVRWRSGVWRKFNLIN